MAAFHTEKKTLKTITTVANTQHTQIEACQISSLNFHGSHANCEKTETRTISHYQQGIKG